MEEKTIETVDLVTEDQIVENPAADDTAVTETTEEKETGEKEQELFDTIAKIASSINDLASRLKTLEDERSEREKKASGFFKPVEGDRADEVADDYTTRKRQTVERRYF